MKVPPTPTTVPGTPGRATPAKASAAARRAAANSPGRQGSAGRNRSVTRREPRSMLATDSGVGAPEDELGAPPAHVDHQVGGRAGDAPGRPLEGQHRLLGAR